MTIELAIAGLGLTVGMGILLGTMTAVWRDSWIDTLSMILALIGGANA